jgi:hypothetical protein
MFKNEVSLGRRGGVIQGDRFEGPGGKTTISSRNN